MTKLLFVVLLELKKLLSVVVAVDHSLWHSSDGEMVVFAHFGFLCPGVANICFCCVTPRWYVEHAEAGVRVDTTC